MDSQNVTIYARFAPDGSVVEISERPEELTPQQWFNFLSNRAGNVYEAFAGGRAAFRLARSEVDALRRDAVPGG